MACDWGTADVAVGQGRAANRGESFVPDQQPVPNSQAIANGDEGPPLALFGALSVTDVDRGRVVIAHRQRGADRGVHAAAQEDHRAFCVFTMIRCYFERQGRLRTAQSSDDVLADGRNRRATLF